MFNASPPGYQPTTTQPGPTPQNGGWMNFPQQIPNCPTGLESLTMVDQLLVQKIYVEELHRDGFLINNSSGQKVYYVEEDSDGSLLQGLRPFDMKIFDKYINEAIHLYRPLACQGCFFPCCMQSIEVLSSPGIVAGRVDEEWSILLPKYAVKNASGETVLRIEGPFRKNLCCGSVKFKIMSADGRVQGKISWYELGSRNDADFVITFPMDLDVSMKAVLLGASFLINAVYFEHQP
ncbi:unnamed protein product [Brassicogethes aeneus]|uniref:Phospholipid scramblase n=1 Tax=Brassicogethes aeneus TaxID=1431903 RepID=A0A9P0FL79_BRAAE|nr:unnamed protein product [Brassicogethes aeneus]